MTIWKRLFYMIIYGVLAGFVRMLVWIVVLLQLGTVAFSGEVNQRLLNFGRHLTTYLYHILLFLTFNTDELTFPFASWSLMKDAQLPTPRA